MIVLESGDKLQGDASAATIVDYTVHGVIGSTATQLADGQLPIAINDLYTSAAIVIISGITIVNTDTVLRTINLYLKPSAGTARRLIPKDMTLQAGFALLFDGTKFSVMDTTGQILYTLANSLTVEGPASSTDHAIARFNLTSGKVIQNSGVTIDDANVVAGALTFNDNLTMAATKGIDGGLRFKVGSFTRDVSIVSGTQAVIGVGFKPSLVMFSMVEDNAAKGSFFGSDDATVHKCTFKYTDSANFALHDSYSIVYTDTGGANYYIGAIQSMDSDGFTINWTKNGSPTGTISILYTAFR